MSEINENIYKETTPSSEDGRDSFEIKKTTELDNLSEALFNIKDAVDHDEKITEGGMRGIEGGLNSLTINIDGEEFPIKDLKNIPNLKENIEIWREIKKGNFEKVHKLTILSIAAAESLSKHDGTLYLSRLVSMSEQVAELLSKHENDLYLNSLTSISDQAAEALSEHKGDIFLSGLISLSNQAAESLSKHEGELFLEGLVSLSDQAAESLSKHEGKLWLDGITSISDKAAESLSKHEGCFLNEEMNKKVNKFKK